MFARMARGPRYEGPRCEDCGASVDDVALVWNGDSSMRAGYWLCADDREGCAERTLLRYGGDTLVERALRAHETHDPQATSATGEETPR